MDKIKEILSKADLKHTAVREKILESFYKVPYALSVQDLQSQIPYKLDKVTVYRTVHTFVENGLLHDVAEVNGIHKYGLCSAHCPQHRHHEEHVHFTCQQCSQTYCLPVQVNLPELPSGFKAFEAKVILTGECQNCSS